MVFNRTFKKLIATALSVLALPLFYNPTTAISSTTGMTKGKALGIGGGVLGGAALITTVAVLLGKYFKNHSDPISKFESLGDGCFKVDHEVKQNAAPETLALILEAFDDIFNKYPSLPDYIKCAHQVKAAENFQKAQGIEELVANNPYDDYAFKIKFMQNCPSANILIKPDLIHFSMYFNKNALTDTESQIDHNNFKRVIAYAMGLYVYDSYQALATSYYCRRAVPLVRFCHRKQCTKFRPI